VNMVTSSFFSFFSYRVPFFYYGLVAIGFLYHLVKLGPRRGLDLSLS